MTPDDPRHGTRRGFDVHRKAGQVACDACKRAAARYEQERQLDLMHGKPRQIDATGTRRRIQALARLGWPSDAIGLPRQQVWHLTQQKYVLRATAEAVAEVYERLSMSLGPSVVTRIRAERKGWPPPLAWNDIDNDAEPHGNVSKIGQVTVDEVVVLRILGGDYTLAATPAERAEVASRWPGTLNELARLTGWKVERYFRAEKNTRKVAS